MSFVQEWKGHWIWTGAKHPDGYGLFEYKGRTIGAHRISAMLFLGYNLEDFKYSGKMICHKCEYKDCVKPDHIYIGTNRDNMIDRGFNDDNANRAKTHCKNGHEYTPENIYWNPKDGGRDCRICKKEAKRRFEERKKR